MNACGSNFNNIGYYCPEARSFFGQLKIHGFTTSGPVSVDNLINASCQI